MEVRFLLGARQHDAPLAEWFSTGLLLRGGRFDPFAAHQLPLAQRIEHPFPRRVVQVRVLGGRQLAVGARLDGLLAFTQD
jgi:hypothetical protein